MKSMKNNNKIVGKKVNVTALQLKQSSFGSKPKIKKNRRSKHLKNNAQDLLMKDDLNIKSKEMIVPEVAWVIEDNIWSNGNNNSSDSDEDTEYLWIPKEIKNRPLKRCKKMEISKLKLAKIEKDVEIRSKSEIISREVFSPQKKDSQNDTPKEENSSKKLSKVYKSDNGQMWTNDITVDVIRPTKQTLSNTYEAIQSPYKNVMEAVGIVNKSKSDGNKLRIAEKTFSTATNCSNSDQDAYLKQILNNEDNSDNSVSATLDDFEENQVTEITSVIEEEIDSDEWNEMDESSKEDPNESKSKVINDNLCCKFYISNTANIVLVLLKSPIYLYGAVRLTLLTGNIQVYGYSPQIEEEVEVFAPRGCGMVSIAPIIDPTLQNENNENKEIYFKKFCKNYGILFFQKDLNELKESFLNTNNAIILLKQNKQRKNLFAQLERFLVEKLFPITRCARMDRKLYYAQYKLQAIIHTRKNDKNNNRNFLRYPKMWQNIEMKSNSRIMIVGGKSVGKSTLVRYLCNKNIKKFRRILLIDLDIGQPEIFVPQTISCTMIKQPIIGPGFLLNLQPDKAFVIGHKNIVLCPEYYLESIYSLIDYCNAEKSKDDEGEIPWIINTMGYNKGFGMELISSILVHLTITDLIQLQCRRTINNFDYRLEKERLSSIPLPHVLNKDYTKIRDYCFHIWPAFDGGLLGLDKSPDVSSGEITNAKNMRYSMILSRLTMTLSDNSEWITDIIPIKASLKDLTFINMVGNVAYPSGSDEEKNLIRAAEGSMVYLCRYNCPTEMEKITKPIECLGIGIVRAIDYNIDQLYLLPALPLSYIGDVNCLAICEIPLPSMFYMRQGPSVSGVAPYINYALDENVAKVVKHFQPQSSRTKRRKNN